MLEWRGPTSDACVFERRGNVDTETHTGEKQPSEDSGRGPSNATTSQGTCQKPDEAGRIRALRPLGSGFWPPEHSLKFWFHCPVWELLSRSPRPLTQCIRRMHRNWVPLGRVGVASRSPTPFVLFGLLKPMSVLPTAGSCDWGGGMGRAEGAAAVTTWNQRACPPPPVGIVTCPPSVVTSGGAEPCLPVRGPLLGTWLPPHPTGRWAGPGPHR